MSLTEKTFRDICHSTNRRQPTLNRISVNARAFVYRSKDNTLITIMIAVTFRYLVAAETTEKLLLYIRIQFFFTF